MRELTRPLLQDWSRTVTRRQVLLLLKKKINVLLRGQFNSWAGKLKFDHSLQNTAKLVDGLIKRSVFMLARL